MLRAHGASFYDEIVLSTGLLRTQVENALAELVVAGRVSSDSFGGLRALLTPSEKRKPLGGTRRHRRAPLLGIEEAGRWSLVRRRTRRRVAEARLLRARPGHGRARGARAAAALRRRVLETAAARGRMASAVARPAARAAPARGARRCARRSLRRGGDRRTVRAARSGERAARDAASARCPARWSR